MCHMLHEVITKAMRAAREPLEGKAGIAIPLYKKGAVTEPAKLPAKPVLVGDKVEALTLVIMLSRLC